jgi:hypothetical protein
MLLVVLTVAWSDDDDDDDTDLFVLYCYRFSVFRVSHGDDNATRLLGTIVR